MKKKEFVLLLLLQSFSSVLTLRVCTRRHYKVHSTAILQRVELISAEKCVERCIENLEYCHIAQYTRSENKSLGVCTLHSEIPDEKIHPDATLDPLTVIYQLLDKCPPFTASDITHRISKLHRDALQDGRESAEMKARLADAFFPESRDHVGLNDDFKLEGERYAVMRSIEEVEIAAAKNRVELPRDPFDGPRFHQSSHERERWEGREQDAASSREKFDRPIHPIVSHRGHGQPQQMSAPIGSGSPCLPNADCVRTMFSLDTAPCPARQGDPCAPKRPCMNDDCYHVAPEPQPQHFPVPEWTEWSDCTATCGLAVKNRQCLGGLTCVGLASIPCQLPECSTWTLWSPWSLCTASCGVGEKERTRICQPGRNCPGPSHEVEACKAILPCPSWSSWTAWTGCTNACGKGIERRSRICQNGLLCPGVPTEERVCDKGPCPHWSPWSQWEQCSKECGAGETFRSRECIDGHTCEGASEEKILCNQQPCPDWSQWTSWTVCDNTCGEESIRLRNRKCLNADNNNACNGPAQDQMSCPYKECPKFEEWGEWSDCSTTCGQGVQKRNRKCDTGNECRGPADEMRFCQVASCPYWGDWTPWSGCSVSCGQGVCERTRRCITDEFLQLPTLEELERDDSLEKHDAKEALIERAKIVSKHKKTNETRLSPFRVSASEQPLGGTCDGNEIETKICDAGPCCSWDHWTEWSSCIGCGGDGVSKRNRICSVEGGNYRHSPAPPPLSFQEDHPGAYITPLSSLAGAQSMLAGLSPIVPIEIHRGKRQILFGINARPQCHCPGDSFQTKPCPEPIPCQDPTPRCEWSEWGEWCGCMRCRGGKENRRRFCDRVPLDQGGLAHPDETCDCGRGNDFDERDCPVEQNCFTGFRNGANLKPNSREREFNHDREQNNGKERERDRDRNRYPTREQDRDRFDGGRERFDSARNRFDDGRSRNFDRNRNQGSPRHPTGHIHVKDPTGFSASASSLAEDQYVPIDSVIGRVQLRGKEPPPYAKKDSPDAFETTEFPYKVCHWSKWSDWSSCHENFTRERKRFCVGEKNAELVSNCECIGRPHEDESCNNATGSAEQSNEEVDQEIESSLDKLLESGDNDDGEEIKIKVTDVQCDWTKWSQWSVCTASCGEGRRMRKRRCPCGDTKCGHGTDSDSESCHGSSCDTSSSNPDRKKPIFTIVPDE